MSATIEIDRNERTEIRAKLGGMLRTWRAKNNLPLKTLAGEIGVSIETVSSWEHGHRFPGAENLDVLASYMGIPVCRLFCERRENGKSCPCVPKRDST